MKIILIDDSHALGFMLSAYFKIKGHIFDFECNPKKAVEDIRNGLLDSYEYILLDLLINGISGIDIFKELKKRNLDKKVIIISGCNRDSEVYIEALKLKVPILKKVFNTKDLVESLETKNFKKLSEAMTY